VCGLERELRIVSRCCCGRTRTRTRVRVEVWLRATSGENLRQGVAAGGCACGLERELEFVSRCGCRRTCAQARARTKIRFESKNSRRGVAVCGLERELEFASRRCFVRTRVSTRVGTRVRVEVLLRADLWATSSGNQNSRRGVAACGPACGLERELKFVPRCCCVRTRARTENRVEVLLRADLCADSSEN